MQAKYIAEGREIDYTPGSAVAAGQVVIQSGMVGIAKEPIAANTLGALSVSGLFDVQQNDEIIPAGAAVYWDADGDSVSGTAGEGAATATPTGNTFIGFAQSVTAADDDNVRVALRSAETVAGQVHVVSAVVATTGGATTGLIPAGTSFAVVTSDNADKQISLPAAVVADELEIYVTGEACELISSVAAHKVNDVVVGATNELALVQDSLYRCKYVATNKWIVTGVSKLGVVETPLTPDAL